MGDENQDYDQYEDSKVKYSQPPKNENKAHD